MQEALLAYHNRYSASLDRSEKEGTGRIFFKLANTFAPKKTANLHSLYHYFRVLDDAVDEADTVLPVKKIILSEKSGLDRGEFTTLQEEYLRGAFLEHPQAKRSILTQHLSAIMDIFITDLNIRYYQEPLNTSQLRFRNIRSLWPLVATFSLGWGNRNPRLTPNFSKLLSAWGTYDNIRDLEEDLNYGLILISQEDIKKFELKFTDRQQLPIDQLQHYYDSQRIYTSMDLMKNASAIFNIGLPFWMAAVGYMYFQTRPLKLSKPLMIRDTTTFQVPLDAINQNREFNALLYQ